LWLEECAAGKLFKVDGAYYLSGHDDEGDVVDAAFIKSSRIGDVDAVAHFPVAHVLQLLPFQLEQVQFKAAATPLRELNVPRQTVYTRLQCTKASGPMPQRCYFDLICC
jgi:hypothetical protein